MIRSRPAGRMPIITALAALALLADGYLEVNLDSEGRRYHFRMNLLREWWLRYVVL